MPRRLIRPKPGGPPLDFHTPGSGAAPPPGTGVSLLEESAMRLDKYLKVARLIKRRTLDNEDCDNGLVTVNDKTALAS